MALDSVPVYEPGDVILTLADGQPRLWAVRQDGGLAQVVPEGWTPPDD